MSSFGVEKRLQNRKNAHFTHPSPQFCTLAAVAAAAAGLFYRPHTAPAAVVGAINVKRGTDYQISVHYQSPILIASAKVHVKRFAFNQSVTYE